jgi:hypothetical protein
MYFSFFLTLYGAIFDLLLATEEILVTFLGETFLVFALLAGAFLGDVFFATIFFAAAFLA